MIKKIKVKLFWKIYFFEEMTVGDFWAFSEDYEYFLQEYFLRYALDYKKISSEKLEKILKIILPFEQKDILLSQILDEKNDKINDFHITIWRFCYILKFSFSDVIKMPFSIFLKMSEDLNYIIWEKEQKPKKSDFKWEIEKQKLKELFGF